MTASPLDAPAIILVAPQLGENVGASARAMYNGGLADLRLVTPRADLNFDKANALAMIGKDIVTQSRVYPTLGASLENLHGCLATTARLRKLHRPLLTPREAGAYLVEQHQKGRRLGILFGCEASGLDNDALSMAEGIIAAPFEEGRRSLNLAQAVLLISYEWRLAILAAKAAKEPPHPKEKMPPARLATLNALFERLDSSLTAHNFLKSEPRIKGATHRLRASLLRAELTEEEAHLWHGVLRSLFNHLDKDPS